MARPTELNPDIAELVAWTLYRALERVSPTACISGEPFEGHESIIDGGFDLLAVAREMIREFQREGIVIRRGENAR